MADKMRRMVRKQLNIDVTHDAALKRLATERGVSESEIVRLAIDELITHDNAVKLRDQRSAAALESLFAEWDATPWNPPDHSAFRFGLYDDLG
jgi:hypothetical protein